jgi:hypothetical protein
MNVCVDHILGKGKFMNFFMFRPSSVHCRANLLFLLKEIDYACV